MIGMGEDAATLEDLQVTPEMVHDAAASISDAIRRTPCEQSQTLSAIAGCSLYLKFENLQFTASFKERGALNFLLQLDDDERRRGVVAMSAGNHAQGVAHHATRLGIPAKIVMPEGTPLVKVENTAVLGAEVIVHGQVLEEATDHAKMIAARDDMVFVHPFDTPYVIAGQGTIALEFLDKFPNLDCLVIPIGGGGLISGMAVAAKDINPDIEIVGVQAELFPSMLSAIRGDAMPSGGDSLAEGIAVKHPGDLTQKIVRALVDDIVTVSEDDLEHGVSMLLNVEKTVAEGAGAAGLSAVLAYPERFAGKKVGLVICGGNIDPRLLSAILVRDLIREGRLARLRIRMRDIPGQLVKIAQAVADHGGNIIDVNHHRLHTNLPAKGTYCDLDVETRDEAGLQLIIDDLKNKGFEVQKRGAEIEA
ncbi:MAG: threonine ammonia-lyase [Pseudomonadota bacterium]